MADPDAQVEAAKDFEAKRPLLLGLAYRLLGSMWDAEDVVQEAYLRWLRVDHEAVREPKGYLITVVSRLALDQLRSARVRRESYTGPWLPEPVDSAALGPLDTVELRDSVSFATVHLMERLTPPERAVFVLREAFGLGYDEIAPVVDRTADNCRQLHHRSRERLASEHGRFATTPDERGRLLQGFLTAAQTGDLDQLTRILSDDVTVWTDGGGKVRAARRPVTGQRNVIAFIRGLIEKYPPTAAELGNVNGEAAGLVVVDGMERFIGIQVQDGRISEIYAVLNPEKLSRLRPAAIEASRESAC
jgi:RNA polymerase sigma-70 factor (ECF subfamily)